MFFYLKKSYDGYITDIGYGGPEFVAAERSMSWFNRNVFMLEKTYREILEKEYGIVFTDLIAIGNVPIGRSISVQSAIVVRQDMEAAVVEICHIKLAVEGSAGVICRIEKELFGNYENDF